MRRYDRSVVGTPSVIVLEFNELSPRLMDRFIEEGHLPNFARLRRESTVATTDPEEPQNRLNPWIQWVTLHSGVPRAEHGIEKLGEAARLEHPTISQVLAEHGRTSWVCGTMNVPGASVPSGAFLPDPWNPDATALPLGFSVFSDFVRSNVQEHTNAAARMSMGMAARFGWFVARHGLRLTTVRKAAGQIAAEKRGGRGRWARASVLDRFQWDLFRWQLRRERPAFATFFSNSTAHYQHMYWRNLEPEVFSVAPTADEQAAYADAVLHGYREMDGLVAEAIDLADDLGATLMMCTALSQQPYIDADATGGKHTHRPRDFEALLETLGIGDVTEVAPVMAGEFRLFFPSAAAAATAAARLEGVKIDGREGMSVRVIDNEVFTGCRVTELMADDVTLIDADGSAHRFYDLFYRFETAKSGYHHPDGMWWTRTGVHRVLDEKVPLRAVAPTVLDLLGIEPPDTMACDPIDVGAGALGARSEP